MRELNTSLWMYSVSASSRSIVDSSSPPIVIRLMAEPYTPPIRPTAA
jgi:hypothetical protein